MEGAATARVLWSPSTVWLRVRPTHRNWQPDGRPPRLALEGSAATPKSLIAILLNAQARANISASAIAIYSYGVWSFQKKTQFSGITLLTTISDSLANSTIRVSHNNWRYGMAPATVKALTFRSIHYEYIYIIILWLLFREKLMWSCAEFLVIPERNS